MSVIHTRASVSVLEGGLIKNRLVGDNLSRPVFGLMPFKCGRKSGWNLLTTAAYIDKAFAPRMQVAMKYCM